MIHYFLDEIADDQNEWAKYRSTQSNLLTFAKKANEVQPCARKKSVKGPNDLNFSWSDPIEKLGQYVPWIKKV